MATMLSRKWWVLLARGVAAVAFGVVAFASPAPTLAGLVALFGFFALVDGVLTVVGAVGERKENDDWVLLLMWGLVGVAAAVVTFRAPGLTAIALVLYVGAWAVAKGVVELAAAVRLRRLIDGEWVLVTSGLLSVGVGLAAFWNPAPGAAALTWLLALYAMAFGALLTVLSLKVRFRRPRPHLV